MRTLGDMLKDARKKAGLTAHDVAQRTHVMQSSIYNLEDDNHEALPVAGYVRGYILSYCKVCGVDPTPFLEQYERQSGHNRRDAIGDPGFNVAGSMSRKVEQEVNWRVILIAIAVVAAIATAIYFINQSSYDGAGTNPIPVNIVVVGENNAESAVPEEERVSFSYTILAREGRASNVRVTNDDYVVFDGILTVRDEGEELHFIDVYEAEIVIESVENIIIMQGEANIPIPDGGVVRLTASEN